MIRQLLKFSLKKKMNTTIEPGVFYIIINSWNFDLCENSQNCGPGFTIKFNFHFLKILENNLRWSSYTCTENILCKIGQNFFIEMYFYRSLKKSAT